VMMHGVMAKRSNTWLSDTKHLSVREQSEEEPSMDEDQVDVTIKSLQGSDGFSDWSELSGWSLIRTHKQRQNWEAIMEEPLNVTASAVAFCADLFKAVQRESDTASGVPFPRPPPNPEAVATNTKKEAMAAEAICPQVLTGSLGDADPNATEWAKEAVKVAQLDGKKT